MAETELNEELTIDYNEQMLDYYPEIIKSIREFQALIKTQSLQIEDMHKELTKILSNAYVSDADESRIEKWEKMLNIVPLPQGSDSKETWLEDRKETILARLYQSQKLNSNAISDVVKIFTGGAATSYFKDGVVHVQISPPKNNKDYKFENVEQELGKKIPAHLKLQIERDYTTWDNIKEKYATWNAVKTANDTWESVYYTTSDE